MRSLRALLPTLSCFALAGSLAAQNVMVDKTSLAFSAAVGGSSVSQTLNISSSGAALTFLASPDQTWLTVSPSTGTTPSAVTVTANPSGLAANTYSSTLRVYGGTGPTVSVSVSLVVSAIAASPTSLSFAYQMGSAIPAPQTVTLSGEPTAFTTTPNTSSGGAWLAVNPSNGTAPTNISVVINPAVAPSLTVGSYSGTVAITPSSGPVISLPVTLVVTAEPPVSINTSAVALNFQLSGSNNNPQQILTISAGGGEPLSYAVNATVNSNPSGKNWILLNPSSGTIPAGGSTTVTVSYDTTAVLPAGTYAGTMTLSTPGGAPNTQSIPVDLLVSASPLITVPTGLSFSYELNSGSNPAAQQVTAVSTNVPAGSSTGQIALTAAITTVSGGNWLSISPTTGLVTGTPFSVSVNPGALAVGTYTGTISVSGTGAGNNPQTISVTLTVANDPSIKVNQPSLSFAYQLGQSVPATQTIAVTSSGSAIDFHVTDAAASCGGNWLTLGGSTSGTTPGSFTASINTSGLAAGTCTGSITVTGTNPLNGMAAVGSPLTIPVSLYVSANPELVVTLPGTPQAPPLFTAQVGGAPPAAQTITVSSTAPGVVLTYNVGLALTNGSGWLFINESSGSTATGSNMVSISVFPGLLSAGTYSGSVILTATGATVANSPLTVPVTLVVTTGSLAASPTSLSFTQTAGGSTPAAQMLQITSTTSALSFAASASSSPSNWLSVTPSNGTTPGSLTVNANAGSLTAGTYTGEVTVTASGAVPVTIPVTLTVVPGAISASPASLTFSQATGASAPATQTITVTTAPTSLPYTVLATTLSGGSWLGATATGGVVTVTVSGAGALAVGFYNGAVTISSPGATGSPITIPVTLNILPVQTLSASPGSMTFNYVLGGTAPAAQSLALAASGNQAAFSVATKTEDGASWLQVTPAFGTTPATVSVSINTTGLAAGDYSGTVTVTSPSSLTPVVVPVSLAVAAVATPVIGGISNAGSYATGGIAPGENIVIFGSGIGPAKQAGLMLNSNGTVATTVAATTVTFDGIAAPVLYVSATQSSVFVPFEVAGRSSVQVVVSYQGVPSVAVSYTAVNALPGIYTQNFTGTGAGSILNQDYSVNTASRPAAKGSYVQVYLCGAGNPTPGGTTGGVTPTNGTGIKNFLGVTATVGGVSAPVSFAGSAPGYVEGVTQVNVQIPANTSSGAQPILINFSGAVTQVGVTVAVQ